MGNLLSLDIFENEVHSEEDIIPENSNSLIEQYAFQVLDFSSQYGYEIFFFGSIDFKKKKHVFHEYFGLKSCSWSTCENHVVFNFTCCNEFP